MKTKNIKVAYTSRYSKGDYSPVPKVQMEGRWLEELGFSIGTPLIVEYGEGSIHIRPLTAEELEAAKRQELQAELNRKVIELNRLKHTVESNIAKLSRVAEPETDYAPSFQMNPAATE